MDNERIDALFEEGVMIPAVDRPRWLDAHCRGDTELRRELQRLLAADEIAEGVLERSRELLAENMADVVEMPRRFGIWRVLGALGAGGMGEVWLAERDDGQFRQQAAIKQVAFPTPGLLRRFREERQILAKLEHPGIARLIDGGMDDAGCPWLAMEYVEGVPITQWIRERRLSARAMVELTLRVCDAVQFAHRNLIVHSDIKPSNILVADGAPKLLDFGIARVLTQADTEHTRTMAQLMTPDYAAPELLAGGAITTSVDVYALGVLLYELLSGHRPYRLSALGGAAELDSAKIKPPGAAIDCGQPHARARQRAVHGDLDRIVLTAMAYEPGRRYASVEALASDLRRWLDGRAIAARGHGRWYRFGKFMRRNRIAVAFGAAATLALIATSIFALWQAHQAHLQAAQAQIQADNANAVKDFMVGVFSSADPSENEGIGPNARQLLDAGARSMRQQFEHAPQIDAGLSIALAQSYAGIGAFDKAGKMAARALALDSRLYGTSNEQTSRTRLSYAEILKNAWSPERTRQQTRMVLAYTHDRPNELSVRAHLLNAKANNIAGVYPASTLFEARRAIALAKPWGEKGILWQASAWNVIAEFDLGTRNYQAAQQAFQESAELYARSRGENAPETVDARSDLVFMLVHAGHVTEALDIYAKMVAHQRRTLEPDDPELAETLTNYAYVLRSAGKFKQARETSAQAITAIVKAFDLPRGQRDDDLVNLSILERSWGDLAGALHLLDQEGQFAPDLSPGEEARTLRAAANWKLAGALAERGAPDAITQLERLKTSASGSHAIGPGRDEEWVIAWLAAGQPRQALDRCRALLAATTRPHSPVSRRNPLLLEEGIALVQLGHFDEAADALNKVMAATAEPAEFDLNESARMWRGWLQVRSGHAQAGLRDIEQALAWRRDQLGDDSYLTGEALLAHAEALSVLNRRTQAQRERTQAQTLFAMQLSPNHILSRRAHLPLPQ